MQLKIVLKKRHIGILWVFIAFILPYVEISAVREMLEIKTDEMIISAVVPIMLLLFLYLYTNNRLKGYHKKQRPYFNGIDAFMILFLVVAFLTLLLSEFCANGLLQLCQFILPYLFAREVFIHIKGLGVKNNEIALYGVAFFVVTQLAFLVINIVSYGFSFDGNAESRILSVGGGPVILGYTIALTYAYWLIYKREAPTWLHTFVSVSCVLLAFATGSRGSMWPILLLIICAYLNRKGKLSPERIIMLFIVGSLILLFVDLERMFPRLFLFGESSRLNAVKSNLEAYSSFDLWGWLLGKGIGNFYPYQKWRMDNTLSIFSNYNQFNYNGISLLVQPHNSFVYALMETGVIGLVLYVCMIRRCICFKTTVRGGKKTLEYKLFMITLLLVLFVESTLFITAGSASLWWLIIIMAGNSEEKYLEQTKRGACQS